MSLLRPFFVCRQIVTCRLDSGFSDVIGLDAEYGHDQRVSEGIPEDRVDAESN